LKLPTRCLFAAALAGALLAGPAHASVTIGGTRVIYPMAEREVNVKVDNDSRAPSLVQVWVDDGKTDADPGQSKVPFVVTPPIFRMEPQKSQTLRIMYTGEALPSDRESVFWLNVLDIPPKSAKASRANTLQFAFRTRIKIFVRPARLDGRPEDAPAKLTWQLVPAPDGKGQALRVTNPTPYHVSFSEFGIEDGSRTFKNDMGGMVAPEGATVLRIPDLAGADAGARVHYVAISDHAAALPGEAPISTR